jgi:hypothetical protein
MWSVRKWAGVALVFITVAGHAQSYRMLKPRNPIVCYAKDVAEPGFVAAPEKYLAWKNGAAGRTKSATFDVTYVGFTAQAKAAFQAAVDIWATQITSPVTIHVQAVWTPLDPGVLGSAIWGSVHANFDGAQRANTFYPVALAEKMAGTDLNESGEVDIYAQFSSTFNWYYGLDGKPTTNTYDLVTVVLHELGHGLGFIDSYYMSGGVGYVGAQNTDLPMIYDLYLENAAGQNLFREFSSGTSQLGGQLTSNALFFDSPAVLQANSGQRATIYAPTVFSGGSSIAHLDETRYPSANVNSLMTAQIGKQEANHNPGPITIGAFSDMGWVYTYIQHKDLKDSENITGPYVVKATITSEDGPIGTPQLHYTNGGAETTVNMTPTGMANEYQAFIPGLGVAASYGYYISVADASAREYTRPGKLVSKAEGLTQLYTVFKTGKDTEAPRINHTPTTYVTSTDATLKLKAYVTDNQGLAQVKVQYLVGDVAQPDVTMSAGTPDSLYQATLNLQGLANGDVVKYKIVATDVASVPNTTASPGSGYHEVKVIVIAAAQNSYTTTFDNTENDFFGEGFSIAKPTGFNTVALHTQHPYTDGESAGLEEVNFTSQLRVPIRVRSVEATVIFDEVVLVEPGETGSVFGDADFYDYVIVEGSKDGGVTWLPLADGYDARNRSNWLLRYNGSSDALGNSTAVGDAGLFYTRTLNLLDAFNAGDEVLIRFRLYSDMLTTGWGWAIDNLFIQSEVVATESNPANELKVFPNPVRSEVNISAEVALAQPLTLTLINAQGQAVLTEQIAPQSEAWLTTWDLSTINNGFYVLKIDGGEKQIVKKIVKTGY